VATLPSSKHECETAAASRTIVIARETCGARPNPLNWLKSENSKVAHLAERKSPSLLETFVKSEHKPAKSMQMQPSREYIAQRDSCPAFCLSALLATSVRNAAFRSDNVTRFLITIVSTRGFCIGHVEPLASI
jgi:hypothetical protein